MPSPFWSLHTSSTGFCGETPFSRGNLYRPTPVARWVVQEREVNMKECLQVLQAAAPSRHRNQGLNPPPLPHSQGLEPLVSQSLWTGRPLEEGVHCSEKRIRALAGSVWMLGLCHPHWGLKCLWGSCRFPGHHWLPASSVLEAQPEFQEGKDAAWLLPTSSWAWWALDQICGCRQKQPVDCAVGASLLPLPLALLCQRGVLSSFSGFQCLFCSKIRGRMVNCSKA